MGDTTTGGTAEPEKNDGTLTLSAEEALVVLELEVTHELLSKVITIQFEQTFSVLRSMSDLATHRSWPHDLALATQAYFKGKNAFPQAPLPRRLSGERGIAWRPDQRLSWAAALLPFMGEDFKDWPTTRPCPGTRAPTCCWLSGSSPTWWG